MSPQSPAAPSRTESDADAPNARLRPSERAGDGKEAHPRPAERAVDGPDCPPGCPGNHDDLQGAPEAHRREVAYAHRGDPVVVVGTVEPRTFDHVLSVRLPSDLAAGLRELAGRNGQTASDLIRWAVAALVDSGGEAPTVLAAAAARLNREAADARLKQNRARRHGDDLNAARAGIRAQAFEDAAAMVAGGPALGAPARPIENVDPGGLL